MPEYTKAQKQVQYGTWLVGVPATIAAFVGLPSGIVCMVLGCTGYSFGYFLAGMLLTFMALVGISYMCIYSPPPDPGEENHLLSPADHSLKMKRELGLEFDGIFLLPEKGNKQTHHNPLSRRCEAGRCDCESEEGY